MQAVNPPCGLGFKQIVVLEKLLEPARGQPLPLGAPGEHRAESLLAGRLRLDEPFPGHGSRAATAGFSGLHGNSNHSVLGNFLVSLQRLEGTVVGLAAYEHALRKCTCAHHGVHHGRAACDLGFGSAPGFAERLGFLKGALLGAPIDKRDVYLAVGRIALQPPAHALFLRRSPFVQSPISHSSTPPSASRRQQRECYAHTAARTIAHRERKCLEEGFNSK